MSFRVPAPSMIADSLIPYFRRCTTLLGFALLGSLLLVPGTAHAKIERIQQSNANPTNLVNVTPIRIEQTVQPGTTSSESISVYNDSDQPIRMLVTPVDLEASEDPAALVQPAHGDAEFGARDWIDPEARDEILKPFEKITFDVAIQPPFDAPVGTSHAGLEFRFVTPDDLISGEPSSQVGIRLVTLMQLLLTVPGEVQHDLSIVSARTTDTFRMGSSEFAAFQVRYRNDGNVTEHVTGKLRVKSIFGNTAADITIDERLILRGGERLDRIVWDDLPAFGIFRPTIELTGDDGTKQTKQLDTMILLPPWWVIALIVLALVVPPFWVWWKRRQEWMQYLDDDDEFDDELVHD